MSSFIYKKTAKMNAERKLGGRAEALTPLP